MIEKVLIVIDDSPEQKKVTESIAEHLRRKEQINTLPIYINPNDRPYLDDLKDPNLDNLISGIISKVTNLKPSLVIIDLYYSDNEIYNGLDVVKKLRELAKFKKSTIFLISGKREKVVREIFLAPDKADAEKVKKLAQIIDYRIERFLDKNFKDQAIESLKRINLNEVIPTKLREFEEDKKVRINLFSPKFKSLTLKELADKIELDDPEGPTIINEMLDLTLAHYQNIDAKLQ